VVTSDKDVQAPAPIIPFGQVAHHEPHLRLLPNLLPKGEYYDRLTENMQVKPAWRDARVAESDGLENRCGLTPTVGSNPTPSAGWLAG
jgi:hypothetical protein